MPNNSTPTPFADAAWLYVESGLGSPIWLPPGAKYPPPKGTTGKTGTRPTVEQIDYQSGMFGEWNVGIWLAEGVVTIDVDHHDTKAGQDSIDALEAIHGPLPATWRTTARGAENPSGNRWFRVPPGFHTSTFRESRLGDDVDLITPTHRYVVAPSSIHPEGGTYKWLIGGEMSDAPQVSALPMLPAGWSKHLEGSCRCFVVERVDTATRRFSDSGSRKGAITLLNMKCDELAVLPSNSRRNNVLNEHGFSLYLNQVLTERSLSEAEVTGALAAAGRACKLDDREIGATLESARNGAVAEYGFGGVE